MCIRDRLRAILADFPFNDADDDQDGLSEAVAVAMLPLGARAEVELWAYSPLS